METEFHIPAQHRALHRAMSRQGSYVLPLATANPRDDYTERRHAFTPRNTYHRPASVESDTSHVMTRSSLHSLPRRHSWQRSPQIMSMTTGDFIATPKINAKELRSSDFSPMLKAVNKSSGSESSDELSNVVKSYQRRSVVISYDRPITFQPLSSSGGNSPIVIPIRTRRKQSRPLETIPEKPKVSERISEDPPASNLASAIEEKMGDARITANHRFIASRPNEITIVPGDIVGIIETFDTGLAFGINHTSGHLGMFSLDCLMNNNDDGDTSSTTSS